jgi:hypothetical protein
MSQMHTGFRAENLKERDCLEDIDIRGRIILKCVPQIGFLYLWVRNNDGIP